VDFEAFRPTLERVREKTRKSNAGRKPYDAVVMFKMLVLRTLSGLGDGQLAYQVRNRVSFMALLGLEPGDPVPDEKTVWAFRETLIQLGLMEELFDQFEAHLPEAGFRGSRPARAASWMRTSSKRRGSATRGRRTHGSNAANGRRRLTPPAPGPRPAEGHRGALAKEAPAESLRLQEPHQPRCQIQVRAQVPDHRRGHPRQSVGRCASG